MAARTQFAIVRVPASGSRPAMYQARDVGSVTKSRSAAWKTTDRAAAERLANEIGGVVVELNGTRGNPADSLKSRGKRANPPARPKVSFWLGGTSGRWLDGTPKLYTFTDLGPFRSHAAAVKYYQSQPRNGRALVFRQTDVGYGIKQAVFDDGGAELDAKNASALEAAQRESRGNPTNEGDTKARPSRVAGLPDGSIEVGPTCGGLVSPAVLASITVVTLDGRTHRQNKGEFTKPIAFSFTRIVWLPLRRGGKWNAKIREAVRGKAGVYAIRKKGGGRTTLYVGEGGKARGSDGTRARKSDSPDRLWKTILRHFQAGFTPEAYAEASKLSAARSRRRGGRQSAQLAMAQWGRAERYRGGGKEWTHEGTGDLDVALYLTAPSKLREAETQWIADLEPTEQGELAGDDSFDFGGG